MNDSQLVIALGAATHSIYFRKGALAELCDRIVAEAPTGRVAVVTDTHVAPLHLEPLRQGLVERGLAVTVHVVPAGEASKSLEQAAAAWDALLAAGVDRGTPVVALGGGVVGDLAGFVAATLLRGLPLIHVPTSLMAQVDSSIGGKTAINRALGKNLVGVFHQPRFVFADVAYLDTLPARELRSGLAEVVKHFALRAPDALAVLGERGMRALRPAHLEPVIRLAAGIKAAIVSEDEREHGPRRLLNLGHTLGHAFEAEAGFGGLSHGEAVSLGLMAAASLSEALAGLAPAETHRLGQVLSGLGLPVDWRSRLSPEVLARVRVDKKTRAGRVNLVLLRRLGEPQVVAVEWNELVAVASRRETLSNAFE